MCCGCSGPSTPTPCSTAAVRGMPHLLLCVEQRQLHLRHLRHTAVRGVATIVPLLQRNPVRVGGQTCRSPGGLPELCISMRRMIAAARVSGLIAEIEALVQHDEGRRGIKPLIQPEGELLDCCRAIAASSRVAVITGFPCLIDYSPPTETDGPLGAISIAKTLLHLGKHVTVLTDECNIDVVSACHAGANLDHFEDRLSLRSFPAASLMTSDHWAQLVRIGEEIDLVIAIERAGPNKDGKYHTMRCRDMTSIVCPLDTLLTNKSASTRSIGIGDGGNEVGMGKAYDLIVGSSILNAAEIACTVAAEHLLVASVSNWGGYALSAAAALYDVFAKAGGEDIAIDQVRDQINLMLPTREEELQKCTRMVDAGARDGISGEKALMVDGMPLQVSLDLLDKFRQIV